MESWLLKARSLVLVFLVTSLNIAFATGQSNDSNFGDKPAQVLNRHGRSKEVTKKLPLVKRIFYLLNSKKGKDRAGSIVLVIVGALLLTFLLGAGLIALAWGGGVSATVFIILGLLGLALIVFGAVKIIRSINKKHRTSHSRRVKINGSIAGNTKLKQVGFDEYYKGGNQ